MADIDVVRKGPNVWPWLIAIALIVVAIIWMNRDDDLDRVDVASTSPYTAPASPAPSNPAPASNEPVPPAVSAFVAFAETPAAEAGPAHDYASTGINRLASALDAVTAPDAGREAELSRQLEAFHAKAKQLQAEPAARNHANLVRDVFTSAVDVMATVQQQHVSESAAIRGQIDELRQSAEAVDGGKPLLEQTKQVTMFFDRAADALQALTRARRA